MRFTFEDAADASETGEPIWLTIADTNKICREHGTNYGQYMAENGDPNNPETQYDAFHVLCWLGY